MTHYRLILLALLIATLSGGCGQKAEGTKKDGKKAEPPGPPPPQVEGDHRAATAKRLSELLAEHRKGVESDIDRINKATKIAREEDRFASLKVVQNLQANAVIAINATNALAEQLRTLDRELRHAQSAYAAAAQAYKDRSEDYTDSSLRESCFGWSRHYDALAAAVPAERQRIKEFLDSLQPTLQLCRETKQLLDDYALFLSTYHDATVPDAEAAKYQSTLRGYIQWFTAFEHAVATYRGK